MASAHRHLVLADPAKEAARRQAMREHPSNHAARSGRPLRREESLNVTARLRPGRGERLMLLRRSWPATPALARVEGKLKVLVSLDSDLLSARVAVRGTVTEMNVAVLYGIVRRTNSFLPGMEILVDLGEAVVGTAVLDRLRSVTGEGRLPAAVDPVRPPCRLRVQEPAVGKVAS